MNHSFALKIVLFILLLLPQYAGPAFGASHAAGNSVRFIALGDQGSGGKGQRMNWPLNSFQSTAAWNMNTGLKKSSIITLRYQ